MIPRCVPLFALIAVAGAGILLALSDFGREDITEGASRHLKAAWNSTDVGGWAGPLQGLANITGLALAFLTPPPSSGGWIPQQGLGKDSPADPPPALHACHATSGLAAQLSGMESLFSNYSFTTPASVLGKLAHAVLDDGSADRSACGLRRVLYRWWVHNETLSFSVVGGSASQVPCSRKEAGSRPRWPEKLQHRLGALAGRCGGAASVVNLAQGATDTFWAAAVLDELVDVQATDVLVWEYAINDRLGASTGAATRSAEEMQGMMEAFLASVVRLFMLAGRPVPPIVLVYLWDAAKPPFPKSSAWAAQEEVLARWRKAGLEVLPVLVGESIVPPNHMSVLQDAHHPGCEGHTLIADMVNYALLRALIRTLDTGGGQGAAATCSAQSIAGAKAALVAASERASQRELFPLLNDDAVWRAMMGAGRVGSLMMFKPQAGRPLLAVKQGASRAAEVMHGAKLSAGRSDVKFAYAMPTCGQGNVSFVVEEANLDGLALGWGGGEYLFHTYTKGVVRVFINGVKAENEVKSQASIVQRIIHFFVAIGREGGVPRAPQYVLELCKTGQLVGDWGKGKPQLNWIFGFMRS